MNKLEVRIENWTKIAYPDGSRLYGNIYGHPSFTDGTFVRTSRIIDDHPNGVIETRNTMYRLGAPYAPPVPITE